MGWNFNKQSSTRSVVVSLDIGSAKIFLVDHKNNDINVVAASRVAFEEINQLESLCKPALQEVGAKSHDCYWLLSRKLYKTISLKKPKVSESETDGTLKWLVKDQIDQPLEDVLVSHYKPAALTEPSNTITAVTAEKKLIETIISLSKANALNLVGININELTAQNCMADLYDEQTQHDQIAGYIDVDKTGLIFNFYSGKQLAFTRHIKGLFFPKFEDSEFTLESESGDQAVQSQLDRFLLETQRTLDYCVSQIFRKPIDFLTVDSLTIGSNKTISALAELTELPIKEIKINGNRCYNNETGTTQDLILSVAEVGVLPAFKQNKAQDCNLYLSQYHPKPLEFGFKYASGIAALFVVGFSAYAYLQNQEQKALENQLAKETINLEKVENALNKLTRQPSKGSPLIDINNLVKNRQAELNASSRLLEHIESDSPTKQVKISRVLKELSIHSSSSLWLTDITVMPTTISLAGKAKKPIHVPQYIEKMANNQSLVSKFLDFEILQGTQDSRVVDFKMINGTFENVE